MQTLLVEIGCEEIPAGYIMPALEAFADKLVQKLDHARISHKGAKVYGTPRRLTIVVDEVAGKQETVTTQVTGPPEKAGFDDKGNPLTPAVRFAEKVGVPVSDIRITETPKGRYLVADKKEEGGKSIHILSEILPEVILSLPFPKSMKWGELDIFFARPIRWILALFGDHVVDFTLGNIKTGRKTFGHRFVHPRSIEINTPEKYLAALEEASVVPDISKRKAQTKKAVEATAVQLGGKVLEDDVLLDIVTNLVETPHPVGGRFDNGFLDLPGEVLITAMREHQKYFAVIDENDNLLPAFIAVNNTPAHEPALSSRGHERVLRARLSDASFFYKSDMKANFDNWIEELKKVLFQAKLGSMFEKTKRVDAIATYIAESLVLGQKTIEDIQMAAALCKTDLVSEMVGEFPNLQGTMGRVYLTAKGFPENVAKAVEEHYRPTHSGGKLPETLEGAILAIADKLDSICGCFSIGLVSTGASDPYALRRQGIGILAIMEDKGFAFSLEKAIHEAVSLFKDLEEEKIETIAKEIYDFFAARMENILVQEGYAKNVVSSVIAVSIDNVPNIRKRCRALDALARQPHFEPLAEAFKRVENIIRKSGETQDSSRASVEENLMTEKAETALYKAYTDTFSRVETHMENNRFDSALMEIAKMKPRVDAFFDEVMVMDEDPAKRQNRLLLLQKISGLFRNIADFSRITG